MRLEPDLFGSIVLVREWGRIGGASRALCGGLSQLRKLPTKPAPLYGAARSGVAT
jgi:hypothetical protein